MVKSLFYVAMFVSSAAFGLASVLEQIGARKTKTMHRLNSAGVRALLRQTSYLIGLALDGIGILLYVLAAHNLPLFFVQSVLAASILVTALGARLWLKIRLSVSGVGMMLAICAGLVLITSASGPATAIAANAELRLAVLAGALLLGVLALSVPHYMRQKATVLAALAGISFSGVAVALRILPLARHWWQWFSEPLLYAVMLYGFLGMFFFSSAIQKSSVTRAVAIGNVIETLVPITIGLTLLGDKPDSHRGLAMLVGVVLTTSASILLALHTNLEEFTL